VRRAPIRERHRRSDQHLIDWRQARLSRYAVYGATKAALTQLSAILRAELGPRNVRVSDVQPGLTGSELAGNVTDSDSRAGLEEMFRNIAALRPADIADLAVYLISRPPHVNLSTLDIVPTRQT
jgi:NADP-dependent 3-hydroxy acid dehydrogenase YdfG